MFLAVLLMVWNSGDFFSEPKLDFRSLVWLVQPLLWHLRESISGKSINY
jgi:hypothetical protein